MASTIKVDKIEGSTGSTVTIPTGQTLTVTDGLAIGSIPTITVAKGGTNTTSYSTGDILYASGATTLTKLAKPGTPAGEVLTFATSASAPSWAAAAGGGKIGQVLQAVKTDRSTVTGATGTLADIPDLTISITPSATDSKILVMTDVYISVSSGYAYNITLVRDSTATIYIGDASSSRGRGSKGGVNYHGANQVSASFCYLDSPATTSATTYKLQWWVETSSTGSVGASEGDGNAAYYSRIANSITVMEVLA